MHTIQIIVVVVVGPRRHGEAQELVAPELLVGVLRQDQEVVVAVVVALQSQVVFCPQSSP